MQNLHDKIMNLQVPTEIEDHPAGTRIIYKTGHRDARHAAAELSLSYDNLIDLVESDIEDILKQHTVSDPVCETLEDVLGTIRKVRSGEYQ